jgi:hypothetical protein
VKLQQGLSVVCALAHSGRNEIEVQDFLELIEGVKFKQGMSLKQIKSKRCQLNQEGLCLWSRP